MLNCKKLDYSNLDKIVLFRKENDVWLKKLVVNDPKMYFHRLSAATEQSNRSNQCDQMTSLLKDPPKKFSLSKIAAPIIPPLNVVCF